MSLFAELGMRYPIIQAPMAGVQNCELAMAVTGVGALGSLPAAMLGTAELRKALEQLAASGPGPFNINFFCHRQREPDPAEEHRWQQALAPFYAEFGVSIDAVSNGPGRAPFNAEHAAILAEFNPAVVSFHFGLPAPELLARVKASGARVLSSATTVDEALWLEARGVDAVIAQGLEAGGHRGMFLTGDVTTQLGTLALVPQIVAAVKLPVIAAGGIADAHGVAAARALGAAGVQVGSAYLLCPEASTSAVHRTALVSDAARHTALTHLFTGRPARAIVNRLMCELGPLGGQPPAFPLATTAIAPLRAAAEAASSGDFSPLWCGQNANGCRAIPAGEITRALAAGLAG